MAKKKAKAASEHVLMQVRVPLVLAGQVRQIAYWAETEPETVIRVFLAAALLKDKGSQLSEEGHPPSDSR